MTTQRKFLADVDVDGKVKSTLQGNLLGSFTDMPTASATNLGLIVLYVGQTTSDYNNNSMYECIETSGVYSWKEIPISGASITSEDVIIQE